MIFWRIKFDQSSVMPPTEYGYQVMDDSMVTIGVYDDNGTKHNGGVAYHTTQTDNVDPPSWAGSIGA